MHQNFRTVICTVLALCSPLFRDSLRLSFAADQSKLNHVLPSDVDAEGLGLAASVIEHAVENEELLGAVIFVMRGEDIILHEAFGFRDLAQQNAMQLDSLFRMASNSKVVTAAGIMALVDQGKVDLDASVGTYLPAFDVPAWQPVTIRHLLTHTSGSRIKQLYLKPLLSPTADNPNAPEPISEVSRFASIAPEFGPGETYSYNNACYNIAAAVIEKVTGSYKEHLRKTFYEPLGMNDSCNHEPDADHSRMSVVTKRNKEGQWVAGWKPGDAPDWPFPRGSGGMVSTARDYAKFCRMLLHEGVYNGQRILSRDSVAEITSPQALKVATTEAQAAKNYGLGLKVSKPGGLCSHTGSDGTYVWFDPSRDLVGMVLVQKNAAPRPRTVFRKLIEAACPAAEGSDQDASESLITRTSSSGFYKDIFMSGGVNLTSRKKLHAAESLELNYEYYAGADRHSQNRLIIGDAHDTNGILLYPDGRPRFRMIYVNGGSATAHGKSLTKEGRNRIREFYRAGGSYVGSCAGSFLCGRNVDTRSARRLGYLHIFPYNTLNTGLKKTRLDHVLPEDSPLLKFGKFSEDGIVESVYHNNGNWLAQETPDNVEVLATYLAPEHKIDGGAAIWAFQESSQTGRIVSIGCHPEGSSEGERLTLTEACFQYALQPFRDLNDKGAIPFGQTRHMNATTEDGRPADTRIGDRQYHDFTIEVTAKNSSVSISVATATSASLKLLLSREMPPRGDRYDFAATTVDGKAEVQASLSPGTWYASVLCETAVKTIEDADAGFYRYVGDRSMLNGVPYDIHFGQSTATEAKANGQ